MSDALARTLACALAAAQAAADPVAAVRANWPCDVTGPVALCAIGKAAPRMLLAALDAMQECGQALPSATDVFMTAPPEFVQQTANLIRSRLRPAPGSLHLYGCDHPLPTRRNVEAAKACAAWVASRPQQQTLIVLLSGGGSAHLCWPRDELAPHGSETPSDDALATLACVTALVQRSGADIRTLNTIRKHLEHLKGGGLLRRCSVRRVIVLVLSDVLGDPLDVIASGPCTPDPTTFTDALKSLAVLDGMAHPPAPDELIQHELACVRRARDLLEAGAQERLPETLKSVDGLSCAVEHRIIASNRLVVDAVAASLHALGAQVEHRYNVAGDASHVAQQLIAQLPADTTDTPPSGLQCHASVIGGEWTVRASGTDGVGGPSQELALAAALHAHHRQPPPPTWGLLAYSTDGNDGPTSASGGIVGAGTWDALQNEGVDVSDALVRHDSFTALARVQALIRTGPTGTNLNHIAVLLWYPHAQPRVTSARLALS